MVDSQDPDQPKSPDAAIYKIGSGVYDMDKFDGIGFKMRMVGNKKLNLSNLVLGLRGGDGYNVYPIKLSDAVDPDGDALPALSDQFQEFVISPQLSIEDANTVYENKADGTPSELKVLDEILGIHLYALDEECSAILEIQEVYLVKAGEETIMDSFDRAAVNKADDNCWWRDSTGFIVQKGATLSGGKKYQTDTPDETFGNLVLTIAGDTSGASIKVGDKAVAWASLKDSENAAVSAAVNGAFYSFVINAENSGLGALTNGFTVTSTSEIVIAEAFFTDMEVPAPVVNYPTFDMNSLFMFDNFNREQSGFNGDYDAAIANEKTLAADLSYQLSYNHGDMVTVDGSALVFDASELAAEDYINYKACNDHLVGSYDYMIMALKAEDGATLNDFRFNIGSGVTYINQMYSAEGLKVATLDQADYPYIRAGFTWLVIDLAASGMSRGNEPFIDYYYSGTGKLSVDFVAFANAEKDEFEDKLYVEKSYEAGGDYDYAGYVYSPASSRYIKLVAETEGTIDAIRFQPDGGVAAWFHEGGLKDETGAVIPETASAGTYLIDLVASGLKEEGSDLGLHVHGDGSKGAISIKVYSVDVIEKTVDTPYVEKSYEAGGDYDYAGYVYSPASSRYIKLVAETEGTIDAIRFQPDGGVAAWFHEGGLKDETGAVIPETASAGTYLIDLVASGLKEEGSDLGLHVHGDGSKGAISIKVYSVDEVPAYSDIEILHEKVVESLADYAYVGGADNFGASYLVLNLKSADAGVDLRSLRVASGDKEAWFKDNALIDADGNAIAKTTAVTAEGITLIIDLAASNLVGPAIHIHAGGFEEAAGSITVTATLQYKTNSTGHILAGIAR